MTRPIAAWMFATSLWAFALPALATAQAGEVTGAVRDGTSGEVVVGAPIILERASDSVRVKTVLTNSGGRFLLVGVPPNRYRIRIESFAYTALATGDFVVESGSTRDLGLLTLAIEAVELHPLSVTAERPVMSFDADRTAYHVAAIPSSHGSTVSELLRTMPGLDVDFDGQVTMRGSRPAIHIDGRPAPMNGIALTAFLEQFPAEHIERIEIIDSPSARYAAEGSGGIVNIVLREGVELGMTGVAFIRSGTRGQVGGGARATFQRGPWTLNSGVSIDRSSRTTSSSSLRQNLLAEPMTFLEQETSSIRTAASGDADVELRYHPMERVGLWVSSRFSGRGDGLEGLTTTIQMDDDRDPSSTYRRSKLLNGGSLTGRFGAGVNYEWERRRHGLKVELDVDTNRGRRHTHEGLEAPDLSGSTGPLPPNLSVEEERQHDGKVRLNIDYTRPWSEDGRIEVGYQLASDDAETDRLLSELDGARAATRETEMGFEHRQSLNALYLSLQRQLGRFGAHIGIRGERSDTGFETPTGEAFEKDYYSLFPSASLSVRIAQNRQLRLSYSRRIQRPQPSILNPVDRSTDPLDRQVGNADIEPAYTHAVSLDVDWSSSFGQWRLAPYYRHTEGSWAQITRVDRLGVSTRTWDNVASEDHYGATAAVSLPHGRRISGLVSLGANGQIRDASNLADSFSSSSLRWEVRASPQVMIADRLSTVVRFAYFPAVDLAQGRSEARILADLGLRYRLLNRRASLDVSFQDPLGLRGSSSETRDLTHVQIRRNSESSRSIRVNMTYAFGGG